MVIEAEDNGNATIFILLTRKKSGGYVQNKNDSQCHENLTNFGKYKNIKSKLQEFSGTGGDE